MYKTRCTKSIRQNFFLHAGLSIFGILCLTRSASVLNLLLANPLKTLTCRHIWYVTSHVSSLAFVFKCWISYIPTGQLLVLIYLCLVVQLWCYTVIVLYIASWNKNKINLTPSGVNNGGLGDPNHLIFKQKTSTHLSCTKLYQFGQLIELDFQGK